MFVIVPDYIHSEIERKIDAALSDHPAATAHDRAALRSQILDQIDRTGKVPDFSVVKAS